MQIKKELTNTCSFPEIWNDKDDSGRPMTEMGYMRSYLSHGTWFCDPFVVHSHLNTQNRAKELDMVNNAIMEAFPSLEELERFCKEHGQGTSEPTEWNLYCTGIHCHYWIRVIIRERDYNLYVHAYVIPSESNLRSERSGGGNA